MSSPYTSGEFGTESLHSAVAITVSNRAQAGVYPDRSGPVLVDSLRRAGFAPEGPWIVPDGAPVASALSRAVEQGYDAALTTGGTGLNPNDETPEVTRSLLQYEIPGIAEALRAVGREKGVPAAVLSRGLAGVAEHDGHRMLIVNLPGSSGGARDGMEVLRPVLAHAIEQMRGGDHPKA